VSKNPAKIFNNGSSEELKEKRHKAEYENTRLCENADYYGVNDNPHGCYWFARHIVCPSYILFRLSNYVTSKGIHRIEPHPSTLNGETKGAMVEVQKTDEASIDYIEFVSISTIICGWVMVASTCKFTCYLMAVALAFAVMAPVSKNGAA
jgi:hypothetical protein